MKIGMPGPGRIRIGFVGFHHSFNPIWNNVTHSIQHRFSLDVSEPGPDGHLQAIPDFLFFSVYQKRHLDPRYDKCTKIFTCEENIRPPWNECDYAMTGDYSDNPKHLRLPIYVRVLLHLPQQECVRLKLLSHPNLTLIKDPNTDWEMMLKTKHRFCNFVVSNGGAPERIRFYDLLSKYRKIDSGGSVRNNIGGRVADKMTFIEHYKFTISFENSSFPGYVSEKVVEPMIVNSLPIYWGCPRIDEDFDPRSLIVATGRKLEDVVDEVVELDRDDDKYAKKMRVPWFHENVQNRYCSIDYLADFLEGVFRARKLIST
jgi:hypothetical protein